MAGLPLRWALPLRVALRHLTLVMDLVDLVVVVVVQQEAPPRLLLMIRFRLPLRQGQDVRVQ
jgi:hypothetical protein